MIGTHTIGTKGIRYSACPDYCPEMEFNKLTYIVSVWAFCIYAIHISPGLIADYLANSWNFIVIHDKYL